MFTLKFFQNFTDGSSRQDVVTCSHYEIVSPTDKDVIYVITYPDHINKGGVEREVSKCGAPDAESVHPDDPYDVCFIENLAGKTIDRVAIGVKA